MFFEKEKGLQSWTYFGGFWKLLRIAFCIVCNWMLELLHLTERIWSSLQLWCESLQLTQWTLTLWCYEGVRTRAHLGWCVNMILSTVSSGLPFPGEVHRNRWVYKWEKELSFTLFSPPPTSRPGPTVILSIFVMQQKMISSSYQPMIWLNSFESLLFVGHCSYLLNKFS